MILTKGDWCETLVADQTLASDFAHECERVGIEDSFRLEICRMSSMYVSKQWINGLRATEATNYKLGRRWSRGELMAPSSLSDNPYWYRLILTNDPGGALFDYTAPPPASTGECRDPARYIFEIEDRKLTPENTPGWMKVELASVGMWDLLEDRPTYAKRNHRSVPAGQQMTVESARVAVPDGGEFAFGAQGFPELAEWNVRVPDPVLDSSYEWLHGAAKSPGPSSAPGPGISEWAAVDAAAVVPAEPFEGLLARWRRLAEEFPRLVSVGAPGVSRGADVGVAPALRDVAGVLPGVAVAGWEVGWLSGAGDGDVGDDPRVVSRFGMQPLFWSQDEGGFVRIGADGVPGEVWCASRGEEPVVVWGSVAEFWEGFTGCVERWIGLLWDEAADEGDEDDQVYVATETLEGVVGDFLFGGTPEPDNV